MIAACWAWMSCIFLWLNKAARDAEQHKEHLEPTWHMWLVPILLPLAWAMLLAATLGLIFLAFSALEACIRLFL